MTDSLIDGPTEAPSASGGSKSSGGSASSSSSSSASADDTLGISYLFYVKIDGAIVGVFSECSGIGAKRTVETFHEGGVNDYAHVMAGPLEHEHIVLKRGVTLSKELWNWFEAGKYDFSVQRRSLSIIQEAPGANQSDGGRGVIKTWNVNRAFPVNWKLSELNAGSSTLAFETLELAHEGISLQAG